MLSALPRQSKKSKFLFGGERRRVGVINLEVIACVLRTTTKKVRQLFEKKVHPR